MHMGRQPPTPGRRGGHEAVECGPPRLVQRIEGAPEGVIMEMTGLNAGGNETRERLMVEKMADSTGFSGKIPSY
jgi:hypothetical protein